MLSECTIQSMSAATLCARQCSCQWTHINGKVVPSIVKWKDNVFLKKGKGQIRNHPKTHSNHHLVHHFACVLYGSLIGQHNPEAHQLILAKISCCQEIVTTHQSLSMRHTKISDKRYVCYCAVGDWHTLTMWLDRYLILLSMRMLVCFTIRSSCGQENWDVLILLGVIRWM